MKFAITALLAALSGLGACGNNADVNTPPSVLLAGCVPDPLQPVVVRKTAQNQAPQGLLFTIDVADPDPEVLKARAFLDRDYSVPAFFLAHADRDIPRVQGEPSRLLTVRVIGLCDALDLGNHDLEYYVTDTDFVDQGADLRKTTEDPASGRVGARDSVRWTIQCEP